MKVYMDKKSSEKIVGEIVGRKYTQQIVGELVGGVIGGIVGGIVGQIVGQWGGEQPRPTAGQRPKGVQPPGSTAAETQRPRGGSNQDQRVPQGGQQPGPAPAGKSQRAPKVETRTNSSWATPAGIPGNVDMNKRNVDDMSGTCLLKSTDPPGRRVDDSFLPCCLSHLLSALHPFFHASSSN